MRKVLLLASFCFISLATSQSHAQVRTEATDTAAIPGFSWATNTNTGLYNPATNIIGFTAGGTERARLTTSGVSVTGSVRAASFIGDGSGLTNLSGDDLGNHTATTTLAMGSNPITFSNSNIAKIYLNTLQTYGIGAESSTFTSWSPASFRWRISGTTPANGSQQMLLTATGLNVSGSLSVNNDDAVNAPGHTWNGDTDTGLYWVGANQFGLTTGGAQRVLVNSSGLTVTGRVSTTGIIDAGSYIYGYAGDSATAPGYTWSGDNNTGMYNAAADAVGFTTGGTQRMVINGSGNVGIGTGSPSGKLHLVASTLGNLIVQAPGDGTNAAALTLLNTTTGTQWWWTHRTTGDLMLQNYDSSWTTFLTAQASSGNVGIGLTNPLTKLDVNGDVYARGNNIYLSHDAATNTNNDYFTMHDAEANTTGLGNISAFVFYSDATRGQTWDSGNALIGTGALYANLSAGIGTTSPSSTLHVVSSFRGSDVDAAASTGWFQLGPSNGSHMSMDSNEIEARNASAAATLYLNNNLNGLTNIGGDLYVRGIAYVNAADAEGAPGWTWSGDADTGFWHPAANTIGITTAGTESVRITSAGRVGIGTTAPAVLLHVSGTARIQNGSVVTCNIGTGTGATSCTSDRRLKDHITAIPSALDKVSKMNGITFHWKASDAPKGEHLGVIAQDVEKVFPQAVETMENGYKTVDYAILVSPLIEAVKELKAQNEKLTKDLDALRKQVESQKAK